MQRRFQGAVAQLLPGEAVVRQNRERSLHMSRVYTPEEFGDYIIKSEHGLHLRATLRAQMLAGCRRSCSKPGSTGRR